MENHSIGKLIARLRSEKGLTQAELAKRLNITDKAVSKWENEDGEPSISLLPAIAEEFGITLDYLMRGIAPSEDNGISKLEKCAKNEDVELFNSLPDSYLASTDEYGKTLFDYIVKYKSIKIANAAVKRGSKDIRIAIISECMDDYNQEIKNGDLTNIRELADTNLNLINPKSIKCIVLSFNDLANSLMQKAIKNKNEKIIEELIEVREAYNSQKYTKYFAGKYRTETYRISFDSDTEEKLLDAGLIDLALKLNRSIDPARVEIARLKKIGEGDSDKIEILKMVERGRLDYVKLLKTKKLSLIEKGFKEYPSWIDIGDVEKSSNGYLFRNSVIRYGEQEKTYIQIKLGCWKILRLGELYYEDRLNRICLDVDVQSAEEAVERINKDLARLNIILARATIKELGFSRELRMKYICDYYNRFLFEECVELAYKKLKEFFEIACELNGTVEEMLESFFSSISVSSFKDAFSKEKLSLIVKAYQKLEKGTFDEDKDMFSSDVISHLGKIFDEKVNLFCEKYNY